MTGYDFHPEAETDLDEIWEFIAAESVTAADRVIGDIHQSPASWPHSWSRSCVPQTAAG
jgi:plasmid stabilization system protein ParE